MTRFVPRRRVTLNRSVVRGAGEAMLGRGREIRTLQDFEQALADLCGGGEAVAVDSGRHALAAVLTGLQLAPGSQVIVPDYTLDSLALIIRQLGLEPVPVDVDRDDYNLDAERVEAAITPRSAAVMATHLFGRPCDLDALLSVTEQHGLPLIEDCAHALASQYRGRPVGGCGRAACLSFASIKTIHALGGGAVVTRDADLASRVRAGLQDSVGSSALVRTAAVTAVEELLGHPRLFGLLAGPLLHRPRIAAGVQRIYRRTKKGGPSRPRRMAAFQAALGRPQAASLAAEESARARVAAVYRERLTGRVHLQAERPEDTPAHYAEVARLDRPAAPVARALYGRGIDAGTGHQVMQSCSVALGAAPLPCSAELLECALELPQSSRMSVAEANRVCDALLSVL